LPAIFFFLRFLFLLFSYTAFFPPRLDDNFFLFFSVNMIFSDYAPRAILSGPTFLRLLWLNFFFVFLIYIPAFSSSQGTEIAIPPFLGPHYVSVFRSPSIFSFFPPIFYAHDVKFFFFPSCVWRPPGVLFVFPYWRFGCAPCFPLATLFLLSAFSLPHRRPLFCLMSPPLAPCGSYLCRFFPFVFILL